MSKTVLQVNHLKTYFTVDKRKNLFVRAVDDVSFSIDQGEIVALVGESGSGKSTIAYTIMGMYETSGGEIIFDGEDIANKKRTFDFKKKAQIVFQDPGSSLNSHQDVKEILSLPLKVHKVVKPSQLETKIIETLDRVGLSEDFMYKSPTAIGGGEKQLVSIARALCSNPEFIILDEPTSNLDVSIQAKIINMLLKLHEEQSLSYLFITHDLSLVRNISTKVIIMYLGKICEIANTEEFYGNPHHPYTQMLLSAIPVVSEEEEQLKPSRIRSTGEIPSPVNIPKGCSFNTRCHRAVPLCFEEDPEMIEVTKGHFVRCHLYGKCKPEL
ncbi:ABC transporter ATP-binding protein [Fusibacter paucivorans]|uniref:ABC transporter ATP-binding protein n=1 Tax=Fusibacter paucivorans TaxID=76009 RepID=A0ABS5PRI6_9FIRM|nr:ABC transporter ATP-binding protein [Fusibacter paucivorans]MBS7527502.1 ABC transporter ATP-binding protein [Fusibacter paucivorans]